MFFSLFPMSIIKYLDSGLPGPRKSGICFSASRCLAAKRKEAQVVRRLRGQIRHEAGHMCGRPVALSPTSTEYVYLDTN
eukprot:scaffold343026_cov22-Prasinocladus_malaysianus.AAC.1